MPELSKYECLRCFSDYFLAIVFFSKNVLQKRSRVSRLSGDSFLVFFILENMKIIFAPKCSILGDKIV